MDGDKEEKDYNNNNREKILRESGRSSSSSFPSYSSSSTFSSSSTTTSSSSSITDNICNITYHYSTTSPSISTLSSVDCNSLNIMGRKNFKPKSVSCLTHKQTVTSTTPTPIPAATTVNQSDNQSADKSKQQQPFKSKSTTPIPSKQPPYHPHHYHHHRHHHHSHHTQEYNKSSIHKHYDDKNTIPREEINILHSSSTTTKPTATSTGRITLPTSTPPPPSSSSSSSSSLSSSSCSVHPIEKDDSISRRKSDNSNLVGLSNCNSNQQQSTSLSSNIINKSLIKEVINPMGRLAVSCKGSDASTSGGDGSGDQITVKPLQSKVIYPIPISSTSPSSHPTTNRYNNNNHVNTNNNNNHSYLNSPRKSKKILSSISSSGLNSSRWLYRSASDPGMVTSPTIYSTHTSALLLTTGAYSASPNFLSPSQTPTPPPSQYQHHQQLAKYSPFYTSPKSPIFSQSVTPPNRYLVPSLSSNASTPTPPPQPNPPTSLPALTKHLQRPSDSSSTPASTVASQFFQTQMPNTKKCVLRLDGFSYLIFAEEDDLSGVQPDTVPNEVREWLASTFTRNNVAQKRRSEEKPKFRSVANAIRAGIMVDRLYRRLCCSNMVQIPTEIADRLKSIDDWSYDCFKLNETSNNQALKYISYELLTRYGLVHKFKIPLETLESCLNRFEQGYTKFKNPYHNNIHAADVTQTVHYMLSKMGLVNWLTDLEIFATLLAAIIHDFQHTGTTNNFHVMSESETALLYNDRAVLENFHVSAAFRILKENECNILVNLNKEEYRELRTLVIDMVLATDMSSHFQQIKTMKSLLSNSNEFTVDKSKALSLVLHCCDISHPSKQWDVHRRWTELLLEEFFRQGDKERELGLPYSPLCDRNTTLVAESQIGFIDFIVAPSLEVCGNLLNKVYQQLDGFRNSSESSEESLDDRLTDIGNRPKSLSAYKNKRTGLSVDSADIPINSRPVASAPASPRFSHCSSFTCKAEGDRLRRPWTENLEQNRKRWQERATIDAIQREQNSRKQTADGISLSMSPESEL